jgi:catalase-peroxidase
MRLLGPETPAGPRLWQDPTPAVDHPFIDGADITELKSKILASGLSISRLVATAWASASTFRGSDERGGANGARIRLAPAKDWAVNVPQELTVALAKLEEIQKAFNAAQSGGKTVSLADLIVLGGCAGVEQAAKNAGHDVRVALTRGCADASQGTNRRRGLCRARTEGRQVPQFCQRRADPVRRRDTGRERRAVPDLGVFTSRRETLTNDFFVNLLNTSVSMKWEAVPDTEDMFVARDRASGEKK